MSKIEITAVDTSTLPKVGAAECDELLKAVKNGDKEARDKFITANLRLVLSVCKRFRRDGVSQDDLFQIGAVGLIKALNNFDVSQNVKFSTYAVPMIIGEIRRALRDVSGIKVTRSVRDTAYKALKAKEKLTSDNHFVNLWNAQKLRVHMVQLLVQTALRQQFFVRSRLGDTILRQHQNLFGVLDRSQTMRDHKCRTILGKFFQRILHHFLTLVVQSRSCLIKDQNRWIL